MSKGEGKIFGERRCPKITALTVGNSCEPCIVLDACRWALCGGAVDAPTVRYQRLWRFGETETQF